MVAPIVPNFEYGLIDGQSILVWCNVTSLGATTATTGSLPTYAPKIDIRIGNPVISNIFISDQTAVTGTEVFIQALETERASAPDSTGEWNIEDADTINIYLTADHDGFLGVSYIAFGGTRA